MPYQIRFMREARVHYVHCENYGTARIVARALATNPNNQDIKIYHGMQVLVA
jgi:hypothetical protein